MVAMLLETMLQELGHEVEAIAGKASEAAILAREAPIDFAVLDVNLNGEFVFPLAEQLRSKGVPFLFATAYADDDRLFPSTSKQAPRLAKPVLPAVLVTQLRKLLG